MSEPLVSVICLCYNQVRFVEEALESVWKQTYSNIELIVVDDASTDGSSELIKCILKKHPESAFIPLRSNQGNCKAFNQGWRTSKGSFVIDLAADDVLLPMRIEEGVRAFQASSPNAGVQFSDAHLIDEDGRSLGKHSDRFPHADVPQGDLYIDLIKRYFINSPTMMIHRDVLDQLNGYDETLHYEDFDFWVRSARHFPYIYLPQALVKQRKVANSMSVNQFKRGNAQQESTYRVCRKIMQMNRTSAERAALRQRVRYEFLQAMKRGEGALAWKYLLLWHENRLTTLRK